MPSVALCLLQSYLQLWQTGYNRGISPSILDVLELEINVLITPVRNVYQGPEMTVMIKDCKVFHGIHVVEENVVEVAIHVV